MPPIRYRLRTLLILLALGPPLAAGMLAFGVELREAYRKSQCSTYAELQTPITVFGIPTPLESRIVPHHP